MKCFRCTSWPCECRDGATLILGDCREVLPVLPAASVLMTDPPYGIGEARGKNKSRTNLAVAKDYGVATWDDEPPPSWLFGLMLDRCKWAGIWGGNYFPLSPSSCWLVWDKDNGANDFADCELAWTNLPKAVRRIRYRWAGMLQEKMGDRKEARFHPTQKPLDVMLWALSQFPDEWTDVLDPFAGSGTTLVAAKQLGKKATGIEISERYAEICANRLRQEVLQFSD